MRHNSEAELPLFAFARRPKGKPAAPPRRIRPAELPLDPRLYLATGLSGCPLEAQRRALAFCERFTGTTARPKVAAMLCLDRVRQRFAGACDGE